MRLGELPDLSSDSKIVFLPFASSRTDANSFLIIKVALKEIRCACVQKQQAPINQLLNVSGLTRHMQGSTMSSRLAPPRVCPRCSKF